MDQNRKVSIEDLTDLCTPWCVHVVATLRIADHIESGVTELGRLAIAAECDTDSLGRVLRHLIKKGVFLEPERGHFALNDPARELLDSGGRMFLDLNGIGGRMAHAWGTLLAVVRTGAPSYQKLFGRPFWEDLDANPEVASTFNALMGPLGHGIPDHEILVDRDWDRVKSIVDVGGGTGGMLSEILRNHPSLSGTLVDLPSTIAQAAGTFQISGVADRATLIGQSFFEPLPAGAEIYLLNKVLNDWPDSETIAILRCCAQAARPHGRIIIMGGVTPDDTPPSLTVEMVLLGGKTNTLTEFREIALEAGLEITSTGRQPTGRFIVECRPT